MLKIKTLALTSILVSCSSLASIKLNVQNDSAYDIDLTNKEAQTSSYVPQPQDVITSRSSDAFTVLSMYPDVIRQVDVEYSYGTGSITPKCHFKLALIKDYRSGNFLPQRLVAEDEKGSYRDRAICAGKIDSFNMTTGDAVVTFSMNRRKY